MDGFENDKNIIVIAATNRPDVLDAALLRPGRFDRQIIVDVPDYKGRLGILEVHTKKVVLNKRKVDLKSLAKGTPGMVGADLANIVNEAALLAAREKKRSIDMDDFEEAEYNFEEAYFLAPDDVEALLGLAKALEQAERWRKSRNYYMELIDKNPNDPQYYYGVYRTYFGEGRLEDAQEYLNKATALRNSN